MLVCDQAAHRMPHESRGRQEVVDERRYVCDSFQQQVCGPDTRTNGHPHFAVPYDGEDIFLAATLKRRSHSQ